MSYYVPLEERSKETVSFGHSPEPWRFEEKGHFVKDAEGQVVVDGTRFWLDRRGDRRTDMALPYDLRRVVACVNFCREFSTEWLTARRMVYAKGYETLVDIAGFDGLVPVIPVVKDPR